MNRTKRIQNILEKYFDDHTIIVKDNSYLHKSHNNFDGNNETHIIVELIKKKELKFTRLELHKKINSLLKKEFKNGLHALQIKII